MRIRPNDFAKATVRLAFVVGAIAAGDPAVAGEPSQKPDCFDAVVSARIVGQTPTAIPDCGEDCIVVSWPWIVDLWVDEVLRGRARTGRLTVLTVQHTEVGTDFAGGHWWLRRNTLGGFNVLRLGNEEQPRPCKRGLPPAQAYITPGKGQTLNALRKEGERLYGPGR